MNQIQVVMTLSGYVVYGPFASILRADANKQVTYSNVVEGSAPYARMLRALKRAA